MQRYVKALSLTTMLILSTPATAGDWQIKPADGEGALTLVIPAAEAVSYRFECTTTDVIATQTGATKLMDLSDGQTIGDDASAVMPKGAAMMALFSGKGDPEFQPADAVKNPAGGWDLAIRLPKNDKRLKALGKSDMLSLFTTGYTIAVAMDDAARAQWNDFMQRCKIAA